MFIERVKFYFKQIFVKRWCFQGHPTLEYWPNQQESAEIWAIYGLMSQDIKVRVLFPWGILKPTLQAILVCDLGNTGACRATQQPANSILVTQLIYIILIFFCGATNKNICKEMQDSDQWKKVVLFNTNIKKHDLPY